MKHSPQAEPAGFTLIELLCVIAILAVLFSLLLPTVGKMTERANNVKCVSNLKQLAVAANAAASDHDNTYPPVEFDPENPAYTTEQAAQPLTTVFAAYGITSVNLQCPEDIKGPNHFAQLGSSYMWKPQSADETTAAIKVLRRRSEIVTAQARVQLCTDYEAVHFPDEVGARKRMNVVYADGHVVAR